MTEYNEAVDVILKTLRWDEGLALSIFVFVERSFWKWNFPALQDLYLKQSPSDVSFFVDFLDTKEWGDFIKDWFLMFSGEIPNKRAPRFQPVWITVSNWQALVIQKVDNAVHCLSHYPADNAVGIHNPYSHWIVIYPVDCAIEHLINRGQNYNVNVMDKRTSLTVRSSHVKYRWSTSHNCA